MTSASDARNPKPPRPMVPPALWALGVVGIAERVVLGCGFTSGRTIWALAVAIGVMVTIAAITALALSHLGAARAGTLVVCIASTGVMGALCAGLCCQRQLRLAEMLGGTAPSSCEFVIASELMPNTSGYRCRARVRAPGMPEGFVWLTLPHELPQGTRITCVGRYASLRHDEYGQSSWLQGVCGSVRVIRVLAHQEPGGLLPALRTHVTDILDPTSSDTRALLAGCACGVRAPLRARGLDQLFAACGLAHLIAVSGSHLALVSSLLSLAVSLTSVGPLGRVLLLGCLSGMFVALCSAPVSAVRAWLMSVVAFGSQIAGRRAHALSSLSVVALMMALLDPNAVGELAFVLSVVSVVGLCLLLPYETYVLRTLLQVKTLPRWMPRKVGRRLLRAFDACRQAFSVALVCQFVTIPLTADAFGRISLIGPVANVIASPFIAVVQTCCLLAIATSWVPAVSMLALGAADLASKPLLRLLEHLARLPCASVSVEAIGPALVPLCLLVAFGVLLLWPTVTRRFMVRSVFAVGALVVLLLVRWRFFSPARVVVLDVGQGDAILVQDGSTSLLIDTGPDEAIRKALARQHVLHLDAVVITHQHDDHYGGLASLAGSVACEQAYCAQGVARALTTDLSQACEALTGHLPLELSYGDTIRVGHFALRMVWPTGAVSGMTNDESLMMVLSYRRDGKTLSALLTGDAEREEVSACIDQGDVGDIDLLKVGHHGSDVSIYAHDAHVLSPDLAIASAGEGNAYGHPRIECIQILEEAGALFVCTKDVGDVEVRPGREGPVMLVVPQP